MTENCTFDNVTVSVYVGDLTARVWFYEGMSEVSVPITVDEAHRLIDHLTGLEA